MYTDNELVIRPVEQKDLTMLWESIFKEKAPEWKKWDAPYFPHQSMSFDMFKEKSPAWIGCDDRWVIEVNGVVRGTVSYYFEDETENWLECGIIIHKSGHWNKQIGTRALTMWIDHLFQQFPTPRVGLTTWSGNKRMIRVGEKLGMQMEGRMRKVRFYEGEYYDSVRMGILREEWEELKPSSLGKN